MVRLGHISFVDIERHLTIYGPIRTQKCALIQGRSYDGIAEQILQFVDILLKHTLFIAILAKSRLKAFLPIVNLVCHLIMESPSSNLIAYLSKLGGKSP